MKLKLAVLCALGLATANAMACYTVYDKSNRVVYHALTPPVDMRLPLHQTLPRVFPGGHMVFGNETDCPREHTPVAAALTAPRARGGSPLLTDQSTAAAMNLPHTVVAGGVALVNQRPEGMRPGVVVAESMPRQAGPDTRSMGAGPSRSAKVITEMHNPPLEAVQDRNGMAIRSIR